MQESKLLKNFDLIDYKIQQFKQGFLLEMKVGVIVILKLFEFFD